MTTTKTTINCISNNLTMMQMFLLPMLTTLLLASSLIVPCTEAFVTHREIGDLSADLFSTADATTEFVDITLATIETAKTFTSDQQIADEVVNQNTPSGIENLRGKTVDSSSTPSTIPRTETNLIDTALPTIATANLFTTDQLNDNAIEDELNPAPINNAIIQPKTEELDTHTVTIKENFKENVEPREEGNEVETETNSPTLVEKTDINIGLEQNDDASSENNTILVSSKESHLLSLSNDSEVPLSNEQHDTHTINKNENSQETDRTNEKVNDIENETNSPPLVEKTDIKSGLDQNNNDSKENNSNVGSSEESLNQSHESEVQPSNGHHYIITTTENIQENDETSEGEYETNSTPLVESATIKSDLDQNYDDFKENNLNIGPSKGSRSLIPSQESEGSLSNAQHDTHIVTTTENIQETDETSEGEYETNSTPLVESGTIKSDLDQNDDDFKENNLNVGPSKGSRSLSQSHESEVPPSNAQHDKFNVEGKSGKAEPTSHSIAKSQLTLIVTILCFFGVIVIFGALGIVLILRHQHGTLDIELQEKKCGKDKIDEEGSETHAKLLDIELPAPSVTTKLTITENNDDCL